MILNVDNGEMSDKVFREFVRHNLPTIIGYAEVRQGLIERGRITREVIMEECDLSTTEGRDKFNRLKEKMVNRSQGEGYGDHDVPCGSQHHYDRETEPFHKK